MNAALFTYRADKLSLSEALSQFAKVAGADPVALVYAPGWCGFSRVSGGQLKRHDGSEPADAYEVRAFTASAELRWLNDARTGAPLAAVVLSDTALSLDWEPLVRAPVIDRIDTTYLLWGQGTGAAPAAGWSQLATARIGALPVPHAGVPGKGRVKLCAVEYLAADEFGSAYVLDERLTGLEEAADA